MNYEKNYRELESTYYMPAFSRDLMLVKGSGCNVTDAEGKTYLDLVAGIAVCSSGHCHPKVVQAIQKQAAELIHCSNLYYVPHQGTLAKRLVEYSGLKKAFFSNSGAEANEGAIKLARIRTGKTEFIACEDGFHGRTMASLACTHKPAIREPFLPLNPRCFFVPYGDAEAIRKAINKDTAGVIIEPVQGEAGVIIPPEGYLREVREICDEKDVLLILDEVQTGIGRTGKWFAYQHEKIQPDIVSLAKGIASGFPMGAIIARDGLEFSKSEHGSTFAGGPVACAAAIATLDVVEEVLPSVAEKGARIKKALSAHDTRVAGLMVGVTIGDSCSKVQQACMEKGVLVNCAAHGNIRLVPPLVISPEEIDRGCEVIDAAIRSVC
ncbi:MAG TPA: aspartate aminotransferase family protein [Methanospirillum sp.]|jgi:acetylornithine/N-succinyldiaminopimelate aminotransferase|uniref:aspartate aminotransferase family protein n=1 Tax=Methanospirillum sp. TaxID=45200 RepID=UPI001BD3B4E9|nr:aspartate aminotransferase family protein [Methanospirillum sp.]HQB99417.1 aspartate aminotransferase family protein [Methanospirillum sp.]